MDWWRIVLVLVVSYLIGSLNISILVSRVFLRVDIRDYGSGNAGSTNAYRVMGKKWAVVVAAGDILKGVVTVLFGYWMMSGAAGGGLGRLLAGLAVILGHVFPVFFKFRGGKGVMTTAAILAVVDWRVCAVVLGVFLVTTLITRWVSLGSVLAALFVPACMYGFHRGEGRETWVYVVLSAVISLLIVFMHRENIGRLIAGTERRFTFKGRAMLDTIKTRTIDIRDKTSTKLKTTTRKLRDKARARSKFRLHHRNSYLARRARRGNRAQNTRRHKRAHVKRARKMRKRHINRMAGI
ncbi:MAG: glycerol-3-phosphate 1-O-acyltransferase PlsY [Oscillospiraceae bacterium]|jgi:glycerol-3-phosphate acyltransferase PlsY|nr:glycerol-3-phosphate 1-O-acyltransferase PlsY [Oscillospiraceae bacterium]